MKKLVITLLLGISFFASAQDLNNWQVGINLNSFVFSRINNDQKYSPGSYTSEKSKQDFPNGYGVGLTIEKNWNPHWGFKTGFEYANQNQKYITDTAYYANDYETTLNVTINYYKIPVTIQYYFPLKEKLYLIFNQGIQTSFLGRYKTIIDDKVQTYVYTNETFQTDHKYYNQPEYHGFVTGLPDIYKKSTFGILGSVGLKGFLSERLSWTTNLRYEYDLTYADAIAINTQTTNTRNFRLGLELGLQYNFSLIGCKICENQKH